jgi:hypothetical protein
VKDVHFFVDGPNSMPSGSSTTAECDQAGSVFELKPKMLNQR